MALPDMSFTNNLTVTPLIIRRGLVSVSDRYEWNGRAIRHRKMVTIEGYVRRGEEGFDRLLTDTANPARAAGLPGTLVLPWTTLEHVKLVGINFGGDGKWIEWVPVTMQFEDQWPDGNVYVVDFFGFRLHNPRLSVNLSTRDPIDDYFQMPANASVVNTADVRYAIMRGFGAQGCFEFAISGTVIAATRATVDLATTKLCPRVGMGDPVISYPGLPAGWPAPFNLRDRCPQLSNDLRIAQCIIGGTRLAWSPRRSTLQISVNMIAQPQLLEMVV